MSFLSAVLLLPRVWEAGLLKIADWAHNLAACPPARPVVPAPLNPCVWPLAVAAGVLLLLALVVTSVNIASNSFPRLQTSPFTDQKWVLTLGVAPMFLSAAFASVSLWLGAAHATQVSWRWWALSGAIGYLVLRVLASLLAGLLIWLRGYGAGGHWAEEWAEAWAMWLCALFAGLLGGVLVWWIAGIFHEWAQIAPCVPSPPASGVAWVACLGTPLLVVAFLLTGVLHIGLMGLCFKNEKREWWARMTGWLLICCVLGAGLFGLAMFAPLGVILLGSYVKTKTALISGWIISTAGGLLAGRSGSTSGKSDGSVRLELVAKVAPYVFVAGLLVLLSFGLHQLMIPQAAKAEFWSGVAQVSPARLFCSFAILALLALVLSCRVNINEFSMQLLYRNRLVRCYLGASHEGRTPQLFSGFDPSDDLKLASFSVHAATPPALQDYAGPYPILNCTLNVTHGDRLAWQERKGESFIFTPRFCGYDYQEQYNGMGPYPPDSTRCFRETEQYAYHDGGVYLGTAVATSGAAASPNMGYHTSPPLAFLMTVFNVRLGWWLGNTQRETWRKPAPRVGLLYLFAELFALTDDRSRYVYLSDGGHFENLALYELVRRRCKYIIVSDAGADPQHSFSDLCDAIQKCRTDLGIDIDLKLDCLRLQGDGKYSPAHGVVGTIHYELVDPTMEAGKLVYVKATLSENDPADLQSYKTQNPVFPHDSTADQWFDESQFESYRSLGRFSIESALGRLGTLAQVTAMRTDEIFQHLSWL